MHDTESSSARSLRATGRWRCTFVQLRCRSTARPAVPGWTRFALVVPTATHVPAGWQDTPASRLNALRAGRGLRPTRSSRSSARPAPCRTPFCPTAVQFPVAGQDTPSSRPSVLGGLRGPLPAVPVLGQGRPAAAQAHRHAVLGPGAGDAVRQAGRGLLVQSGWMVQVRAVPALAQQPERGLAVGVARGHAGGARTCRTRRPPACRPAGRRSAGVGVDCTAHVVPFHRSASVWMFFPLRVVAIPVAVHWAFPVQDTP